ncbi:MAG: phosphoglycerate dehydrogenase [bacterium]
MKILVSDKLSGAGLEILQADKRVEVDIIPWTSEEALREIIGRYHGLLIRSNTKVTAKVIKCADNLRVIGRAGIGVDNVDVKAATEKGVVVMNTPGGNTVTTAEHTVSLIMALSRNIPQADTAMTNGRWDKKKFMGVELDEKILGLIGLGRIGQEIARRAQALRMKVIAFDPALSAEEMKALGVRKADETDGVFREADFVSVHTPLTPQTKNLICKETIARMKDGVRIINCAQGGIVDESDLAGAVESGKVAGAALDVFEQEPPSPDNRLLKLDRVICTPHLGASTREAQENVSIAIAHQALDFLTTGTIVNAVNTPSCTREAAEALAGYLYLARIVGSMSAQLIGGKPQKATLSLISEPFTAHSDAIKNAFLAGLAGGFRKDAKVNEVNAPGLCKDEGIEITLESGGSHSEFTNLLRAAVTGKRGECEISGTVFDERRPRIVSLNGFRMEISPSEYVLFTANRDRPGVIGEIGSFLGEHNINIAGMQFGRRQVGGKAVALFNVDSPVSPEYLEKLETLPNIDSALLLQLEPFG